MSLAGAGTVSYTVQASGVIVSFNSAGAEQWALSNSPNLAGENRGSVFEELQLLSKVNWCDMKLRVNVGDILYSYLTNPAQPGYSQLFIEDDPS